MSRRFIDVVVKQAADWRMWWSKRLEEAVGCCHVVVLFGFDRKQEQDLRESRNIFIIFLR